MTDIQKTSSNTSWYRASVTRQRREQLNAHKGIVLWLTGLSGSGKSTLSHAVEEALHQKGCRTIVLDGDNVRHGLCGNLNFSDADRAENIRRVSELSRVLLEAGEIVLAAFISPSLSHRDMAKKIIGSDDFIELFCDCSIDVCESRDVKGLYKKARKGLIRDFTGISSPYDKPKNPDLCLETGVASLGDCVEQVITLLEARGIINIC